MTKTILIVLGIVIVAIIVGVVISHNQDATPSYSDTNSTSTTASTTDTDGTGATQPQAGKPVVVTNASVAPSDTSAVVTGKVTPNGATTNYRYEYGTTATLGSKTSNQSIGSGYVAISAPAYITGLAKNTTYYFRLVGENSYGTIVGAQYSFQTTNGAPAPVGSIPTTKTLDATAVSRTSAKLNGEVTPNRAATEYWFEYGKTTALGNVTSFVSAGNGTASVSASQSVSGLDPASTYYFRLNAQNQFGTVLGPVLNFKTDGPTASAPSAKTDTVTAITASSATFRGTVNPNGAPTIYWFEYSTDTVVGPILIQKTTEKSAGNGTSAVSASIDVRGLASGKTYSVNIVAQNSLGTTRGESVTFKTK